MTAWVIFSPRLASAVSFIFCKMKAEICEGEYGLRDVVVGVPVQLGKGGAERIIVYDLTPEERKALDVSANAVRDLCATVDRLTI